MTVIIVILIFISFYLNLPIVQTLLMLVYTTSIIWSDFKGWKVQRFDISTAYAVLILITSMSHISPLILNEYDIYYFNPSENPLFMKAIFIFNIGSIIILEVLRRFIKEKKMTSNFMTKIKASITVNKILMISASVFLLLELFPQIIGSAGTIGSFLILTINGGVFMASCLTSKRKQSKWLVFIFTLFLSIWALMYGYLRMHIIIPWLAFIFGDMIAQQNLKKLHRSTYIILTSAVIVFPTIFTLLGNTRASSRGEQRWINTTEAFTTGDEELEGETIMKRLNVSPQLTNVIKLTEKNGFYNGLTLEYLGYVFIPRFIWADKPRIKQGQWFAVEIGNAYIKEDGNANNSINMTVPGEFYLNFGWFGLIIGCGFFGLFIAAIWNVIGLDNIFDWSMRFYLIFLGLFSLGADLQIVPTLIAFLILYIITRVILNNRNISLRAH